MINIPSRGLGAERTATATSRRLLQASKQLQRLFAASGKAAADSAAGKQLKRLQLFCSQHLDKQLLKIAA